MPGITIRFGKRSPQEGQVVEFEGEDFVFGRGRDCEVRFDLDDVSRDHCRVRLEDGKWMVHDLASQNGLFLNTAEVKSEEIRVGDDLLLGVTGPHVEIVALVPNPHEESFSLKSTRVVRIPRNSPPRPAPAAPTPEVEAPSEPDPPPSAEPAEPPRPRRTRLIVGLAAAVVVVLVAISSARSIGRWMRAQAGIVSVPEIPEEPGRLLRIRPSEEIETLAGGEYRLLRLHLTTYSRAGKRRGERVDVIETYGWLPVRVSAGRPLADALSDARKWLSAEVGQPDLDAWLRSGEGDEFLVSADADVDEDVDIRPESLAPGEVPPTLRDRRRGEGPVW